MDNRSSTFSLRQNFNTDNPTIGLEVKNKRRALSYKRLIALSILTLIIIILSILTIKNWIINSIRKSELNTLSSTITSLNRQRAILEEEMTKYTHQYTDLQSEEAKLSIEYENANKKNAEEESLLDHYKTTLNNLQREEISLSYDISRIETEYSKCTLELKQLDKANEDLINISKDLTGHLDLLKKEYDDLINEKKRIEQEQNALSVVGNILHSDIITSIDEYELLRDWIGLGNNKILIQKYKLKGENSNELLNNNKAIIQESKPIIIVIKLSTGQRFGLVALTPLPSLRTIQLTDQFSFMFSFDKRQRYSFIECKENMKTTYIISFSSKMEIHIPDACFKDDHFFNIEEKIKFYKTKKHFQVEYMELYQLYDILQ